MVLLTVFCAVEQRDGLRSGDIRYALAFLFLLLQRFAILRTERGEIDGFTVEGLTEIAGGRQGLTPLVEGEVGFFTPRGQSLSTRIR